MTTTRVSKRAVIPGEILTKRDAQQFIICMFMAINNHQSCSCIVLAYGFLHVVCWIAMGQCQNQSPTLAIWNQYVIDERDIPTKIYVHLLLSSTIWLLIVLLIINFQTHSKSLSIHSTYSLQSSWNLKSHLNCQHSHDYSIPIFHNRFVFYFIIYILYFFHHHLNFCFRIL